MRTYTAGELITRVRQKADIERSNVCTNTEILSYLDAAYADYYSLIVSTYENYFILDSDISSNGTDAIYDLPVDFFKLAGVDKIVDNIRNESLSPFNFSERNKVYSVISPYGGTKYRYMLFGNKIKFIPTPASGITFKIWYTPAPLKIDSEGITIDGVSGWEEYVVLKAAISAIAKQELDTSQRERELAAVEARIIKSAPQRDSGHVHGITDITSVNQDEEWLLPY